MISLSLVANDARRNGEWVTQEMGGAREGGRGHGGSFGGPFAVADGILMGSSVSASATTILCVGSAVSSSIWIVGEGDAGCSAWCFTSTVVQQQLSSTASWFDSLASDLQHSISQVPTSTTRPGTWQIAKASIRTILRSLRSFTFNISVQQFVTVFLFHDTRDRFDVERPRRNWPL